MTVKKRLTMNLDNVKARVSRAGKFRSMAEKLNRATTVNVRVMVEVDISHEIAGDLLLWPHSAQFRRDFREEIADEHNT